VIGGARRTENRKAEEMANGTTGPLNQYERYFAGLKL
jgi:hypothetical protein